MREPWPMAAGATFWPDFSSLDQLRPLPACRVESETQGASIPGGTWCSRSMCRDSCSCTGLVAVRFAL
jgi:hypothetical protein